MSDFQENALKEYYKMAIFLELISLGKIRFTSQTYRHLNQLAELATFLFAWSSYYLYLLIHTLNDLFSDLVTMFFGIICAKTGIFHQFLAFFNHHLRYACADCKCICIFYCYTEYHLWKATTSNFGNYSLAEIINII